MEIPKIFKYVQKLPQSTIKCTWD